MRPDAALTSQPWAEISAPALRHNAGILRQRCGHQKLGLVLKSDAYGHGLQQVYSVIRQSADFIFLTRVHDAFELRDAERTNGWPAQRIVVSGAGLSHPEVAVACAQADVEIAVPERGMDAVIAALGRAGAVLKVHIFLDSGMNREGAVCKADGSDRLAQDLHFLVGSKEMRVVGIMTHLANPDDAADPNGYTQEQIRNFTHGVSRVKKLLNLREPVELQVTASAATLQAVLPSYDAVRCGAALYGIWPSSATQALLEPALTLQPVMSWKCATLNIRPRGAQKVAVFKMGTSHGYPRARGQAQHVLIAGQRCPVIRVHLSETEVDVTQVATAARGAVLTAIFLGLSGAERISAEDLAAWAETINYEIVAAGRIENRMVVDT